MKEQDSSDKNECKNSSVEDRWLFFISMFGGSAVILGLILLIVNLSRYAEKVGWFGG